MIWKLSFVIICFAIVVFIRVAGDKWQLVLHEFICAPFGGGVDRAVFF